MRKLIFIGIVAVGALVGLLAAANDDWATRTVLGTVGALFGAAIGGALTRLRLVEEGAFMAKRPDPWHGRDIRGFGRQLLARQWLPAVHETA
jgi:hypothetical protein